MRSAAPSESDKPCILMIDDEIERQRALLDALRAHYRTSVAADGHRGYQRALAQRPDLILLDVSMPGLDGFAVCRLLKADPATADIPVIFVSSMNAPVERIEGFNVGGVDYVGKPYTPEELLARIRIHLELAGRGRQATATDGRADAAPRNPDEVALAAARRLIDDRLAAPPALAELARMVGQPERRLSRIFHEHTGLTVFAYVREARIREACRLLAGTDLSVQDIADEVGFGNPANFATAFRERMGLTPREFRQSRQKGAPC